MNLPQTAIDLSGMVVLITGGSRGIGRDTALRCAAAGAEVGISWHSRESAGAEVVAAIGPDRASGWQCDMGDPGSVRTFVDRAAKRFGRIDVLINNAATFEVNRFDDDDYDRWNAGWQRTLAVNLTGAANAAWCAMRVMRPHGGGKILNVASRAASRGETEFADYGASKAGLVNLTRSIARACAPQGIVAIAVAPGFVETDMAAEELAARRAELEAQVPLGRIARVEDVSALLTFLASPVANYLNGATIDVNGGSWFS